MPFPKIGLKRASTKMDTNVLKTLVTVATLLLNLTLKSVCPKLCLNFINTRRIWSSSVIVVTLKVWYEISHMLT